MHGRNLWFSRLVAWSFWGTFFTQGSFNNSLDLTWPQRPAKTLQEEDDNWVNVAMLEVKSSSRLKTSPVYPRDSCREFRSKWRGDCLMCNRNLNTLKIKKSKGWSRITESVATHIKAMTSASPRWHISSTFEMAQLPVMYTLTLWFSELPAVALLKIQVWY